MSEQQLKEMSVEELKREEENLFIRMDNWNDSMSYASTKIEKIQEELKRREKPK